MKDKEVCPACFGAGNIDDWSDIYNEYYQRTCELCSGSGFFNTITVEVSAICGFFAISPCAGYIYYFQGYRKCVWKKVGVQNSLSYWNLCTANRKVHRGIFKIRVVED